MTIHMQPRREERRAGIAGELRFVRDESGAAIEGYAAKFGVRSRELRSPRGPFYETIAKGAFKRSLASSQDVIACYEHDPKQILGRLASKTLTLTEDEIGLRFRVALPDTTIGRDVGELVDRGDLREMSFGFITRRDEWRQDGGVLERELQDVDLFDVSVVLNGAYPSTELALRSYLAWEKRMKVAKIAENRAAPGELAVGDLVRFAEDTIWMSREWVATVEEIATVGTISIENSSLSLAASEEDPAARLHLHQEGANGEWYPISAFALMPFSALTKIEAEALAESGDGAKDEGSAEGSAEADADAVETNSWDDAQRKQRLEKATGRKF